MEYTNIIETKRSNNKSIVTISERTDITEAQYQELMQTPIKQVKEESIKELTDAGYGEDLQELGLKKTIEKINSDIKDIGLKENTKDLDVESKEELETTSETKTETKRSRRKRYN